MYLVLFDAMDWSKIYKLNQKCASNWDVLIHTRNFTVYDLSDNSNHLVNSVMTWQIFWMILFYNPVIFSPKPDITTTAAPTTTEMSEQDKLNKIIRQQKLLTIPQKPDITTTPAPTATEMSVQDELNEIIRQQKLITTTTTTTISTSTGNTNSNNGQVMDL